MKLVTALLVRNEADRYLARVLARCAEFSDEILVLDDGSTDDSVAVAKAAAKTLVKQRVANGGWWKGGAEGAAESSARAELWDRASKLAGDGWVLICDADMLLVGDPRPLALSWDVNAWAWPLFDCWDDEAHARVDGPWLGGPTMPRPWMFRPAAAGSAALTFGPPDAMGRKAWTPQWQDRGIHVGHMPGNFPLVCGVAPGLYWKHLAYLSAEHRKAKHAQYMSVADQLSPFEHAHAMSILDQ